MFAGFLLLLLPLLLTGGSSSNHTEPPDAEGVYNQSHLERGSSYNHTEPDDEFSGTGGSSYNHTEPDDPSSAKRLGDEEKDYYAYIRWLMGVGDVPAKCTYHYVAKHLNLSDKFKFYHTRPTKDYRKPTNVTLYIYLYSILDVKENEHELISYFWINMYWKNELITWKPEDFCGIWNIIIPSELLWKPDLTIEEVTKQDKLFRTPYLRVLTDGNIFQRTGVVLVSTCSMQYYRFPFDTQTCSLTFRSIQHDMDHIYLQTGWNNEYLLHMTRDYMKTESEWLLLNATVKTIWIHSFGSVSSVLIYTMTIKRRSILYVANFIVPILFFLCLDLTSFLISEHGGEKLSFKVTVMLAVTVMQLILNEILPSSSDRIPLIAVYCIGVFTLMMLSLLETILMMYLMEKDHVSQDKEADEDQSLGEVCRDQPGRVQTCFKDMTKSIPCVRVFDESPAETPPELLPEVKEVKEGSSSQLTEETMDFERLSHELREVSRKMSLLLSSRKEEKEPGYWSRMTKKLNRIYFIFYLITTSVFLGWVFSVWLHKDSHEI